MSAGTPVGTYDGVSASSLCALPITIAQDLLVEGNETIQLDIVSPTASPPLFLLRSSLGRQWAMDRATAMARAGRRRNRHLRVDPAHQINRGGSTANDACTSPTAAGSGLYNNASAIMQGPISNTTFNASACRTTPTPVWVTLNKQLNGRVVATDQVQIKIFSGGILTASATTTGSTVPTTTTTGLVVLPAGSTLQFEEAVKANGTGPDQVLNNYNPQIPAATHPLPRPCCRPVRARRLAIHNSGPGSRPPPATTSVARLPTTRCVRTW